MPTETFPHYHGPAWLHPGHTRTGISHHDYVIWCDGSDAFGGGRIGHRCRSRIEAARWPMLRQWRQGGRRYQLVHCRACSLWLAVEVGRYGPVRIAGEYGEGEAPRETGQPATVGV